MLVKVAMRPYGISKAWLYGTLFLLALNACTKVGPNFSTPTAEVLDQWQEAGNVHVSMKAPEYKDWWKSFEDPVLDKLINTAYEQNLPLRIAGVRVLQARARLAIAAGEFYPQVQQGFGSATYNRISESAPSSLQPGQAANRTDLDFWESEVGVFVGWEIDFWGRFRRAIESADAAFLGSIAAYDSALVSLTADIAGTYVLIRTLEERIKIARENLETQREGLRIARARYKEGATGERDVQQALTQLKSTEATIPSLEISLKRAANALSILLGMPPTDLVLLTGEPGRIPEAPIELAVGIPADLLRRRPDIRQAELQAAAQCPLIGVAKADLYPSFFLTGSFGFLSSNVGGFQLSDIFDWGSRTWSVGPSFQWNILNYGRITNNVRLQDALLQEYIENYKETVLRAQQEVEDGLVSFIKGQAQVYVLEESVKAAKRSTQLALTQYREGIADYTAVLTAQQALLSQMDLLAVSRGDVVNGVIAVYRAMGGGWEIRGTKDFVPPDVLKQMAERTDWGSLVKPAAIQTSPYAEPKAAILKPDW